MKKFLLLTFIALTGLVAGFPVKAYTLINWTSGMTTEMFNWVSNLFTDLSPILVIVIPIMLVASVIALILSRIGGGK